MAFKGLWKLPDWSSPNIKWYMLSNVENVGRIGNRKHAAPGSIFQVDHDQTVKSHNDGIELKSCYTGQIRVKWRPGIFYGLDDDLKEMLITLEDFKERLRIFEGYAELLLYAKQLKIGDKVDVRVPVKKSSGIVQGTLKYIGPKYPKIPGKYFGIQLDCNLDDSVGVNYTWCREGRIGVLVAVNKIQLPQTKKYDSKPRTRRDQKTSGEYTMDDDADVGVKDSVLKPPYIMAGDDVLVHVMLTSCTSRKKWAKGKVVFVMDNYLAVNVDRAEGEVLKPWHGVLNGKKVFTNYSRQTAWVDRNDVETLHYKPLHHENSSLSTGPSNKKPSDGTSSETSLANQPLSKGSAQKAVSETNHQLADDGQCEKEEGFKKWHKKGKISIQHKPGSVEMPSMPSGSDHRIPSGTNIRKEERCTSDPKKTWPTRITNVKLITGSSDWKTYPGSAQKAVSETKHQLADDGQCEKEEEYKVWHKKGKKPNQHKPGSVEMPSMPSGSDHRIPSGTNVSNEERCTSDTKKMWTTRFTSYIARADPPPFPFSVYEVQAIVADSKLCQGLITELELTNKWRTSAKKEHKDFFRLESVLQSWWKDIHEGHQAHLQSFLILLGQYGREDIRDHIEKVPDRGCFDETVLNTVILSATVYRKLFAAELGVQQHELTGKLTQDMNPYDCLRTVFDIWNTNEKGCNKLGQLLRACRAIGRDTLADEIEQGLNELVLRRIGHQIESKQCRLLGEKLLISDVRLDAFRETFKHLPERIYRMFSYWSMLQSFDANKIEMLVSVLYDIGLGHVAEKELYKGLRQHELESTAALLSDNWQTLAPVLVKTQDIDYIMEQKGDSSQNCFRMLNIWRSRQIRADDVNMKETLFHAMSQCNLYREARQLYYGLDPYTVMELAVKLLFDWPLLASNFGYDKWEIAQRMRCLNQAEMTLKMLNEWLNANRDEDPRKTKEKLLEGFVTIRREDLVEWLQNRDDGVCEVRDLKQTKKATPESKRLTRMNMQKVAEKLCLNRQQLMDMLTLNHEDLNHYKPDSVKGDHLLAVIVAWKKKQSKRFGELETFENLQKLLKMYEHREALAELSDGSCIDPPEVTNRPGGAVGGVPPEEPPYPDLTLDSLVEVNYGEQTLSGVIAWIGEINGIDGHGILAGVELDDYLDVGGTDGTFSGTRCFNCQYGKGLILPLSRCKPDSRFLTEMQTFTKKEKLTKDDTIQDDHRIPSGTSIGEEERCTSDPKKTWPTRITNVKLITDPPPYPFSVYEVQAIVADSKLCHGLISELELTDKWRASTKKEHRDFFRLESVLQSWWKDIHEGHQAHLQSFLILLGQYGREDIRDHIEKVPDRGCFDETVLNTVILSATNSWKLFAAELGVQQRELTGKLTQNMNPYDCLRTVFDIWYTNEKGCNKLGQLLKACRAIGRDTLADEIEQGLNDSVLHLISHQIETKQLKLLGEKLLISEVRLDAFRETFQLLPERVYQILSYWRMLQSFDVNKIEMLASVLYDIDLGHVAEKELYKGLRQHDLESTAALLSDNWQKLAPGLVKSQDIAYIMEQKGDSFQNCFRMLNIWRGRQIRADDGNLKETLFDSMCQCDLYREARQLYNGLDPYTLMELSLKLLFDWPLLASYFGYNKVELAEHMKSLNQAEMARKMLNEWLHANKDEDPRKTKEKLLEGFVTIRREDLVEWLQNRDDGVCEVRDLKQTAKKGPPPYPFSDFHIEVITDDNKLCQGLIKGLQLENKWKAEKGREAFFRLEYVLQHWWKKNYEESKTQMQEFKVLLVQHGREDLMDHIDKVPDRGMFDDTILNAVIFSARKDWRKLATELVMKQSDIDEKMKQDVLPDESLRTVFHIWYKQEQGCSKLGKLVKACRSIGQNTLAEEIEQGLTEVLLRRIAQRIELKSWQRLADHLLISPVRQDAFREKFKSLPDRVYHMLAYWSMIQPFGTDKVDGLASALHDVKLGYVAQTLLYRNFGGKDCEPVTGYVDPPKNVDPDRVGMFKGIQGVHNSSYMDAILFSLFAYNSVFDAILFHDESTNEDIIKVKDVLRTTIVNPLRSIGYVRADYMLYFCDLLRGLDILQGLHAEEKDPEEFIHALLQELMNVKPFLQISQGQNATMESFMYQIFLEKQDNSDTSTVSDLLHLSFLQSDLKLAKVPECLIIQLHKYGKKNKLYDWIIPSLEMDINALIRDSPRKCSDCGKLASVECKDCTPVAADEDKDVIQSFCVDCYLAKHGKKKHKITNLSVPLEVTKMFHKIAEKVDEDDIAEKTQHLYPEHRMELFSVVCIETSHYVAFVKTGSGDGEQWVFFDSMADRQGDQHGYNIPEVAHLKNFRQQMESDSLRRDMKRHDFSKYLKRLLSDAYICFYRAVKKRTSSNMDTNSQTTHA
ncbi:uncharacterized protein [Apostichopus japonicus]|uniref:uncharacterized protein isoform X3 n=1 Tax=Stichopus japonicus TaxID=307972 RepID=UPI003AB2A767